MNCVVYKSRRKADVYLFVENPDALADVPAELRRAVDPLEPVLELALHAGRKLVCCDAQTALDGLREQG